MELPCKKAVKNFSKLSIVTKYTIIFSAITFLISLIITVVVLIHNKNNFEFTFISRVHCFTNSLKLLIKEIPDNSDFLFNAKNIIQKAEKSGNLLYVKTEIHKNIKCNVNNPQKILSFFSDISVLYKTCFKFNNYCFINYFSPRYYQKRLLNFEKQVLIVFLICLIIYILTVYSVFRKFLSPIVCLSNVMKEVDIADGCSFLENSELERFYNGNSKDEIANLIFSYCDMLNRINALQKEQLELQNIINRAKKFTTIGELVSGIAHEINNSLAGIKSCLYNLKKDLPKEKKDKYIHLSEQGVNFIEELIKRLLDLSKASTHTLHKVNLKNVVEESVEFLKAKLRNNNIEIELNLKDIEILGNKYALMQIFLNLIINSIDALKEKETENKKIKITIAEDNEFIYVSFWDNGIGIKKELKDKIFEPFFTTKSSGKGNGLGLFIVDGIVSAFKYLIKINSKEGKWTEITIKIPKKSQ